MARWALWRSRCPKVYDDPNLPTDEKGVARGMGPDIAWFKDPAGNVISVISAGGMS